ncbi:MAG: hypothetical protein H6974_11690 [Gammaproteobacteria bacterium]|nr:hypothetical protein [Gammaproteobacteria bacterium]
MWSLAGLAATFTSTLDAGSGMGFPVPEQTSSVIAQSVIAQSVIAQSVTEVF